MTVWCFLKNLKIRIFPQDFISLWRSLLHPCVNSVLFVMIKSCGHLTKVSVHRWRSGKENAVTCTPFNLSLGSNMGGGLGNVKLNEEKKRQRQMPHRLVLCGIQNNWLMQTRNKMVLLWAMKWGWARQGGREHKLWEKEEASPCSKFLLEPYSPAQWK